MPGTAQFIRDMAITIKGKPNEFTPAFNRVNYYVDSDNKNESGFRYVIDLYDSGGVKFWEGRFIPRPGDGYGEIIIGSIINRKLSYDVPFGNEFKDATNSYFKVTVKVGEEFVTPWSYDDYQEQTSGPFAGFTELISANSHTFVAGDQIRIAQTDGGAEKPMLEGLFTVVDSSATSITIDILFSTVGIGVTVGGSVIYADNRKTVIRDLETITTTFFNGALTNESFRNYAGTEYIINQVDGEELFLTSMPLTGYTVPDSSDVYVNGGTFYETDPGYFSRLYYQNDGGELFYKEIDQGTTQAVVQVCIIGADQGTLIPDGGGVLPLIKSGTKYIEFWAGNNAGDILSKVYRIDIDRRCKIEDAELLFMDRLGSFLSFPFSLRNYESTSISRESHLSELGGLDEGAEKWSYQSTDAGAITDYITATKTIELNSNWLNESMRRMFELLVTSPVTFIKLEGIYYRCEIMDNSVTFAKKVNKKMEQKTITVKLSNQENINV